jgi:hypothetical protein
MSHKPFRWLVALLIALALAPLPAGNASADLGPKPTIHFVFEQGFAGDPVTITSGTLMQCDRADCSDAHALPVNMGPQRFSCEALACSGLAYGFTAYGRIDVTFSDGKLRQSNVFEIKDFEAHYDVTIREDDLLVESAASLNPDAPTDPIKVFTFLFYLLVAAGGLTTVGCILLVVAIIVGIVILVRRRRKRARPD